MNSYTVYFKIFGIGKKVVVSREDINSQKQAEEYVLKTIISENVVFYDQEKIKINSSQSEIDKSFDKLNDGLDRVFKKAEEGIDKTFNALGGIFGKNPFTDNKKDKKQS